MIAMMIRARVRGRAGAESYSLGSRWWVALALFGIDLHKQMNSSVLDWSWSIRVWVNVRVSMQVRGIERSSMAAQHMRVTTGSPVSGPESWLGDQIGIGLRSALCLAGYTIPW